jgi:DNA end-binding protein Ku
VEPDELDDLRPAQDRALRLERFVPPDQCDPLAFSGRSLYLVPDGPAAEPAYGVLCQALSQRQRWAVGRLVLGGHRQLVVVRPLQSTLVLLVLHYPEQVRACPRPAPLPTPSPGQAGEELRLAEQLIEAASGRVDWTAYPDQAAQELRALIDLKLHGRPAAVVEVPCPVLPLVEALRQSLAATEGPKAAKAARPRRPQRPSQARGRRTA